MTDVIPAAYAHLLELPIYAHLGTIRPDDTVQVNPMWFEFVDGTLRFTHTTKRGKFRNLQHNPSMSLSLIDPENPFRYLEVRGTARMEPDSDGAFAHKLHAKYDADVAAYDQPGDTRVVVTIEPSRIRPVDMSG
jgi:PPOX class probable F420-dependent enzyme